MSMFTSKVYRFFHHDEMVNARVCLIREAWYLSLLLNDPKLKRPFEDWRDQIAKVCAASEAYEAEAAKFNAAILENKWFFWFLGWHDRWTRWTRWTRRAA